jgi:hypothetical protein
VPQRCEMDMVDDVNSEFKFELSRLLRGFSILCLIQPQALSPLMAPRVRGMKFGSYGIGRIRQGQMRQRVCSLSNCHSLTLG